MPGRGLVRFFTTKLSVQRSHRSSPSSPASRKSSAGVKKCRRSASVVSQTSGRTLILVNSDLEAFVQLGQSCTQTTDVGLSKWEVIFERILNSSPRLKEPLGLKGLEGNDLVTNDSFQWHCQKFGNFWHHIITCISEMDFTPDQSSSGKIDNVLSQIRAIGAKHSCDSKVAFDAGSWLLFKNAIVEGLTSEIDSTGGATKAALHKLVTFVVSEMKDSFLANIRLRYGSKSSSLDNNPDEEEARGMHE